MTYSIRGRTAEDDTNVFAFYRATGQLKTKDALNHEAQSAFNFIVTVNDGRGGTDSIDLTVTVTDVNEPPVVATQIEDQLLPLGGGAATVDLTDKFHDPEGDALTYTVVSSDASVASVSVTDDKLTITPMATGTATITVSASESGNSTGSLSAPTEPCTSPPCQIPPDDLAPSQSFTVTVLDLKLKENRSSGPYVKDAEWKVMETVSLRFIPIPTDAPEIFDIYDYEFQAVVPHDTGLQAGSQTCDWSRTTATESPWVSLPFNWTSVVSCGLGTGDAKVELRMRKEGSAGDGIKAGESGSIQPPWHRKYHTVTYLIDTGSFAGATVDIPAKIKDVGKVWTEANLGIAFKAYDSSTDAKEPGRNIKIKGYVTGDAEGCDEPPPYIVKACVIRDGTYPHLTNDQKFYVRKNLNWTTDWEYYKDRPTSRHYLPHTLAHEFGHTLGLGHSGALNDVMSPGWTYQENDLLNRNFDDGCTSICDLSGNDEDAVIHLYPSTHSH